VEIFLIKRRTHMAGTIEGGKKAAATNRERHGSAFYASIGSKGGKNGHTGGFAANRELARLAGAKGGRISRRKASTKIEVKVVA
jgi:general stress protein YciG